MPSSRRCITPSVGVSLIVIVTAVVVFAFSIALFLFARDVPQISASRPQRMLVSVASAAFAVLGLAGIILAVADLLLRIFGRKNTPQE